MKLRLDSALGLVKMDPVQAQQILLNLVLNARDALPGGGQISVETGKRAAAVKLAETVRANLPPGLARPALRALAAAGYTHLDQFIRIKVADRSKLHGTGPKGIGIIRAALNARGQSFLP